MNSFFIGKVSHWVALVIVISVLIVAGSLKLHVTKFIFFVGLLMIVSLVLVLGVTLFFDKNERITRETIEDIE